MGKIEKASGISPFPTTIIIPEALYDIDNKIIVHGHDTMIKPSGIYLIIELSAPSLLFLPKENFLGLLAHEFLHYIAHTIDFHIKLTEKAGSGDTTSDVVGGIIPDKEKMTLTQRDDYFYSDPKTWLIDKEVIDAVNAIDQMRFTKGKDNGAADKIMAWGNKNKLIREFERGKIVGYKGWLTLHQPTIERAKQLKFI
jgi:hypothetical protein